MQGLDEAKAEITRTMTHRGYGDTEIAAMLHATDLGLARLGEVVAVVPKIGESSVGLECTMADGDLKWLDRPAPSRLAAVTPLSVFDALLNSQRLVSLCEQAGWHGRAGNTEIAETLAVKAVYLFESSFGPLGEDGRLTMRAKIMAAELPPTPGVMA